jgi:hypothetical protein
MVILTFLIFGDYQSSDAHYLHDANIEQRGIGIDSRC